MITLAMFAAMITLALVFSIPLVKGFQRHPAFTFSASSPVKLMAVNPAIMTPDQLQKEWGNTAPLQSILIPPGKPEVSTNLDIFCNPTPDSGVREDIGIWIEA